MSDFTPTSAVNFDANGSFSAGLECWHDSPVNGGTKAVGEWNVPDSAETVSVWNGSVSLRPVDPKSSSQYYRASALVRIWINGCLILNVILNATYEPANLAVAPFVALLPSGTGRKITVEHAVGGGVKGINTELEMCGMWSTAA